MTRETYISVIFASCGVVCFLLAAYFYWSLQGVYETFAYYGLPESVVLEHPEASEMIWSFRFGIVQWSVAGTVLLFASTYFFTRRSQPAD